MLLSAAALSMPLAAEMVSMTVPTGRPYWSIVALLSYRVLRICSQNAELNHWLPLLQTFSAGLPWKGRNDTLLYVYT
jgi:hypothetical protein